MWHTGAGKSSLLSAALGLMQQVAGEPITVHGRVAFVPQARSPSPPKLSLHPKARLKRVRRNSEETVF